MTKSIAIVMPALNEEKSLRGSYFQAKNALVGRSLDHEIIIVNDGSIDKTGLIADSIKEQDSSVKVIHISVSKGMGNAFKRGYEITNKEFYSMIPSDGGFPESEICRFLDHLGNKDILVPKLFTKPKRPTRRRNISKLYVMILNFLFGLKMNSYTMGVFRTADLKAIDVRSNWNTFYAEIIIKLIIKKKKTYDQSFAMTLMERQIGNSKTRLNFSNIKKMIKFLVFIFYDIHLKK
jgi:glycosyltransferase involved in cell wall biosynthesis